ncbi:hypothetical protein F5Y00DRAFT_257066 [Daldinia vernicosa]|uniref:uncharacterized protein n=1 Tax=Daldinia vernicosa TaxID=114800 RepID=UPI002007C9F1|nr:uncharacterized protein F5Y00DRAFT_257066 [Daldinia vernicosa]KAI0853765.1 hypothetical protein F5Y00DRAFT_257066 [Daldinia vernicosa]
MSSEIVAETLRLELAPFGVDILEIVTGAVKALGQMYFDDFQLPANSLYKSIEDTIANIAQGNDEIPRMETRKYATAVVDEIKKPHDRPILDARTAMGTGLDTLGK